MANYKATIYFENEGIPHCWIRVRGPESDIQHGLGCYDGQGKEPDVLTALQSIIAGKGKFHGAEHLQQLIESGKASTIALIKNIGVSQDQAGKMLDYIHTRTQLPPEQIKYDLGSHETCVTEVSRVLKAAGLNLAGMLSLKDLFQANTRATDALIEDVPNIAQFLAYELPELADKASAVGVSVPPMLDLIKTALQNHQPYSLGAAFPALAESLETLKANASTTSSETMPNITKGQLAVEDATKSDGADELSATTEKPAPVAKAPKSALKAAAKKAANPTSTNDSENTADAKQTDGTNTDKTDSSSHPLAPKSSNTAPTGDKTEPQEPKPDSTSPTGEQTNTAPTGDKTEPQEPKPDSMSPTGEQTNTAPTGDKTEPQEPKPDSTSPMGEQTNTAPTGDKTEPQEAKPDSMSPTGEPINTAPTGDKTEPQEPKPDSTSPTGEQTNTAPTGDKTEPQEAKPDSMSPTGEPINTAPTGNKTEPQEPKPDSTSPTGEQTNTAPTGDKTEPQEPKPDSTSPTGEPINTAPTGNKTEPQEAKPDSMSPTGANENVPAGGEASKGGPVDPNAVTMVFTIPAPAGDPSGKTLDITFSVPATVAPRQPEISKAAADAANKAANEAGKKAAQEAADKLIKGPGGDKLSQEDLNKAANEAGQAAGRDAASKAARELILNEMTKLGAKGPLDPSEIPPPPVPKTQTEQQGVDGNAQPQQTNDTEKTSAPNQKNESGSVSLVETKDDETPPNSPVTVVNLTPSSATTPDAKESATTPPDAKESATTPAPSTTLPETLEKTGNAPSEGSVTTLGGPINPNSVTMVFTIPAPNGNTGGETRDLIFSTPTSAAERQPEISKTASDLANKAASEAGKKAGMEVINRLMSTPEGAKMSKEAIDKAASDAAKSAGRDAAAKAAHDYIVKEMANIGAKGPLNPTDVKVPPSSGTPETTATTLPSPGGDASKTEPSNEKPDDLKQAVNPDVTKTEPSNEKPDDLKQAVNPDMAKTEPSNQNSGDLEQVVTPAMTKVEGRFDKSIKEGPSGKVETTNLTFSVPAPEGKGVPIELHYTAPPGASDKQSDIIKGASEAALKAADNASTKASKDFSASAPKSQDKASSDALAKSAADAGSKAAQAAASKAAKDYIDQEMTKLGGQPTSKEMQTQKMTDPDTGERPETSPHSTTEATTKPGESSPIDQSTMPGNETNLPANTTPTATPSSPITPEASKSAPDTAIMTFIVPANDGQNAPETKQLVFSVPASAAQNYQTIADKVSAAASSAAREAGMKTASSSLSGGGMPDANSISAAGKAAAAKIAEEMVSREVANIGGKGPITREEADAILAKQAGGSGAPTTPIPTTTPTFHQPVMPDVNAITNQATNAGIKAGQDAGVKAGIQSAISELASGSMSPQAIAQKATQAGMETGKQAGLKAASDNLNEQLKTMNTQTAAQPFLTKAQMGADFASTYDHESFAKSSLGLNDSLSEPYAKIATLSETLRMSAEPAQAETAQDEQYGELVFPTIEPAQAETAQDEQYGELVFPTIEPAQAETAQDEQYGELVFPTTEPAEAETAQDEQYGELVFPTTEPAEAETAQDEQSGELVFPTTEPAEAETAQDEQLGEPVLLAEDSELYEDNTVGNNPFHLAESASDLVVGSAFQDPDEQVTPTFLDNLASFTPDELYDDYDSGGFSPFLYQQSENDESSDLPLWLSGQNPQNYDILSIFDNNYPIISSFEDPWINDFAG